MASQVTLVVKNTPSNAEGLKRHSSISGLGRAPGEGHRNPLQYSCQENPLDRAAWLSASCKESERTEVT